MHSLTRIRTFVTCSKELNWYTWCDCVMKVYLVLCTLNSILTMSAWRMWAYKFLVTLDGPAYTSSLLEWTRLVPVTMTLWLPLTCTGCTYHCPPCWHHTHSVLSSVYCGTLLCKEYSRIRKCHVLGKFQNMTSITDGKIQMTSSNRFSFNLQFPQPHLISLNVPSMLNFFEQIQVYFSVHAAHDVPV